MTIAGVTSTACQVQSQNGKEFSTQSTEPTDIPGTKFVSVNGLNVKIWQNQPGSGNYASGLLSTDEYAIVKEGKLIQNGNSTNYGLLCEPNQPINPCLGWANMDDIKEVTPQHMRKPPKSSTPLPPTTEKPSKTPQLVLSIKPGEYSPAHLELPSPPPDRIIEAAKGFGSLTLVVAAVGGTLYWLDRHFKRKKPLSPSIQTPTNPTITKPVIEIIPHQSKTEPNQTPKIQPPTIIQAGPTTKHGKLYDRVIDPKDTTITEAWLISPPSTNINQMTSN